MQLGIRSQNAVRSEDCTAACFKRQLAENRAKRGKISAKKLVTSVSKSDDRSPALYGDRPLGRSPQSQALLHETRHSQAGTVMRRDASSQVRPAHDRADA